MSLDSYYERAMKAEADSTRLRGTLGRMRSKMRDLEEMAEIACFNRVVVQASQGFRLPVSMTPRGLVGCNISNRR